MPDSLVLRDVADGVATITLNRPDALNAWTPELARELLTHARAAGADPAVRAVLIRGNGRAFSAGADVKNPREHTPEGDIDLSTRLREIYNPIILTISELPKPVVAAVQGATAGIGLSLALACDQIVAADDAYVLLAFVRVGVVPDGGAAWHLARRIGTGRAARLMLLAERLPAAEALDWGLVDEVCPAADLDATAGALAQRLAAGPTVAYANVKRVLRAAAGLPLADQLEFEATVQQEHATTADYAEAIAAFKEKRPARFQGR